MTTNRLISGDAFEGIQASRNYLGGSSFELGVARGWATYADAAAATPVDGTGGTANVTFAAQSGALIRNLFSGRLTKDATNRQGQGASFDFTIDAADTGRPVSIAFDFLASAAYVAGDVDVFIYDVTNATLLTPSSIDVAAGKGRFNAFFVATTSTSYRLILHVATTNAAAWTLDTDNFYVGPQQQLSGAPVTDWQAYTPTYNGLGAVTTEGIYWRRIGDHLYIRGRFQTGVVTASTAFMSLPSGLTIDSTKISGTNLVGRWIRNAAGAGDIKQGAVIGIGGFTDVRFGLDDTSFPDTPFSPRNGNGLWSNSQVISLECAVPIANWSSNVTMAERAVEEYAWNSAATTAAGGSDTTSFGYGPAGTTFNAFASTTANSATTLRVRFQTPIQATDKLFLEYLRDGSTWSPVSENDATVCSYSNQADSFYGMGMARVSGSTTDVDVVFGNKGRTPSQTNGAAFAADGTTWAAITGRRWRLRKVAGGAAVGHPVSGKNVIPEYVVLPAINSSTTINFGVGIRFVSSGSPTTQTLQAVTAADVGKAIFVKNTGAGTVTVQGSGGALIDGQATLVLSQYESAQVVTDGTNWFII